MTTANYTAFFLSHEVGSWRISSWFWLTSQAYPGSSGLHPNSRAAILHSLVPSADLSRVHSIPLLVIDKVNKQRWFPVFPWGTPLATDLHPEESTTLWMRLSKHFPYPPYSPSIKWVSFQFGEEDALGDDVKGIIEVQIIDICSSYPLMRSCHHRRVDLCFPQHSEEFTDVLRKA